jgi:hypothetical protein
MLYKLNCQFFSRSAERELAATLFVCLTYAPSDVHLLLKVASHCQLILIFECSTVRLLATTLFVCYISNFRA